MAFRPNPLPRISPKSYRHNAGPNHFSSRFSTSRTNGPRLLSRVKVGTHSAFGERSHTRAHTAKQGAFRTGVLSLHSDCFTRFGNPAWPGFKTANFAAFGAWSWVLPKNAESLGTAMSLCASLFRRRRGPAGLRRPTPPAERTVLAPISPRVQLCLRRPEFPLSAFIPGA